MVWMSPKNVEKSLAVLPQGAVPAPPPKGKKKKEEIQLPAPVETVFSLSSMALVLVTVAVALLSYTSGASYPQILLRTGAAIVGVGTLATFLCSSFNSGALHAAMQESADEPSGNEPAAQDADDGLNSLDRRA
jgi:hypothetical protein